MILILGLVDNRMKDFIKSHKFHDRFMIVHKICNVKHLKEDIEIIIPFGYVHLQSQTQAVVVKW